MRWVLVVGEKLTLPLAHCRQTKRFCGGFRCWFLQLAHFSTPPSPLIFARVSTLEWCTFSGPWHLATNSISWVKWTTLVGWSTRSVHSSPPIVSIHLAVCRSRCISHICLFSGSTFTVSGNRSKWTPPISWVDSVLDLFFLMFLSLHPDNVLLCNRHRNCSTSLPFVCLVRMSPGESDENVLQSGSIGTIEQNGREDPYGTVDFGTPV